MYRLTLVKAWNVEEMLSYSELIAIGQPDFIEVKVGLISMHMHSKILSVHVEFKQYNKSGTVCHV